MTRRDRARHGADASRAAPSSSACIATGAPTANRHLVLYAFPNPSVAAAAPGAVGLAQGRRRGRAQPRQAAAARGVRGVEGELERGPRRRRGRPPAGARAGRARGPGGHRCVARRADRHGRGCAPASPASRRRERDGESGDAPDDDVSVAHRRRRCARLRIVAIAPIVVYQRVISPALPRRCKYEPTCSRYAVEAIGEYGILRGLVLAGWRLLRCNPWSHGGYDPVEAQRVFRTGCAGALSAAGRRAASARPARTQHRTLTTLAQNDMPILANVIQEAFSPLISAVRSDHGVHPRPPRRRQLGAGDRGADGADPRGARAADLQAAEVDAGDAAPGAPDRRR